MLSELLRAVELPPGRVIRANEGEGEPAFWLSDDPVDPTSWQRMFADRARTGLWPLVLSTSPHDDPGRPWESGEVFHGRITPPDQHDAERLMASWWPGLAEVDPDEDEVVTAPFGERWPGLAKALPRRHDPDEIAYEVAKSLMTERSRLGLVAAARGSDALAVMGWQGPVNYHNDIGQLAAIVRSWEERFGVTVVALESFALLHMSVAAPPTGQGQAVRIAVEHFTFCPENIRTAGTVEDYAEEIIGESRWAFWWD